MQKPFDPRTVAIKIYKIFAEEDLTFMEAKLALSTTEDLLKVMSNNQTILKQDPDYLHNIF